MNLNELTIEDADGPMGACAEQVDNSCSTDEVNVYFKDIKQKLINHINEADVILGCVAWLTDFDILDALAKKNTQILIQKEDFCRPDRIEYSTCQEREEDPSKKYKTYKSMTNSQFKAILMDKYTQIDFEYGKYSIIDMQYSYKTNDMDGIRCVGNYNREKKPASPRMHNKFILFCYHNRITDEDVYGDITEHDIITPYAVWTGSYNFSNNAGYSFENALYITNHSIVSAYYNEYQQIMLFSESLDWESDWVEPEYRIGS